MVTKNWTKIKYILALVVLATVLASSVTQAAILVYEPFDYEPAVAVNGLPVTGAGLTGTWSSNYTDDRAKIKWNSLTYSTVPTTAHHWGPGRVWISPWIEAALDPAVMAGHLEDGDELWFSFIGKMPLNTGTVYNELELQIGADVDNNVGIYAYKIDDETCQVEATITIGGSWTGSTGVATFTDPPRLFVGRVIFGPLDTVEVYLPGPDLALPPAPAGIVTGSLDQSAFDMLRSQVWNGNSVTDADEIRIGTTYLDVIGSPDPTLPDVYAGDNMVTWSGQPVQLNPTVVNNDPCEPQAPLTFAWTAQPADGVVFDPGPNVEAPMVTITKPALLSTPIPVLNAGFEAPVLADGSEETNPPGWTDGYYDLANPTEWVVDEALAGVYNPDASMGYGGVAPEGENVAYTTVERTGG